MLSEPGREWRLPSATATQSLGQRFAAAWRRRHAGPDVAPGRAWRVGLSGELGAGKTTFVQGFVAGLGITAQVQSPSYALVNEYSDDGARVLHADFYRLAGPDELAALALDDADRPDYIWLIEWPERAGDRLGPWDLTLTLNIASHWHQLAARAGTERGRAWLSKGLD